MDSNIVGLAAVVMALGIPMAAMYTFLPRAQAAQRRAAGGDCARCGCSHAAGAFRSGAFAAVRNSAGGRGDGLYRDLRSDRTREPDAMIAAIFGGIPLAIGIGFFVDHALIRRDAKAN